MVLANPIHNPKHSTHLARTALRLVRGFCSFPKGSMLDRRSSQLRAT